MCTQRRQSRPHHTGRIYAKELAHRRPGVASAKAVGAEGGVTAPWWQIRPYRLRRGAHAVGGGDDRPATLCQLVGQEGGRARLRVGVGHALAGQLTPTGHAEHTPQSPDRPVALPLAATLTAGRQPLLVAND